MVRGWLLLSSLVFGVLFRLYKSSPDDAQRSFWLTDKKLDNHSFVYFQMEHLIALIYAICIINPKCLKDETPNWLLWLFFAILVLDMAHYNAFFRDETIGWNLTKVLLFSIPLLWIQSKQLLNR